MNDNFKLKINKKDWEAGYRAGYAGGRIIEPRGIDPYSWESGVVEGKGDKQLGKPSQCPKKPREMEM